MPTTQLDPLFVFASAFAVSAFAGLAALLRSGKRVGFLSVLSSMLNTGFAGLAFSLIWYVKFKGSDDTLYCLIGICVLVGLGGTPALDLVLQLCKRGGFSVTFKPNDEGLPDEPVKKEGSP